jgi:hypothetical protein
LRGGNAQRITLTLVTNYITIGRLPKLRGESRHENQR